MARVHIELKRVQTWLFKTTRLRAMVGANVLLGETLRERLKQLLLEGCSAAPPRWKTVALDGNFPEADKCDPLHASDNPAKDALLGISSRDGGHFDVRFTNDDGAHAFAREAAALLRRDLPGLRFRITGRMSGSTVGEPGTSMIGEPQTALLPDLPVLLPCSWTGRGLASATARQGTDRDEVSLDSARRHSAAHRSENREAKDLITLMLKECCQGWRMADTFEELADGRYLAVIHADGNGVGAGLPDDATESVRAEFHHRNRVLLRRALAYALGKIRAASEGTAAQPRSARPLPAPLLPLMLGGDDLLVVCRAEVALPFIRDLCVNLADRQVDDSASKFRLTLGVGAAIASYALPFHQLHQVAEALAASAKRKVRGVPPQERVSVVDWSVYTASWAEKDLAEVRRRDWLRGPSGNLLLSRRPVEVCGHHLGSLQGLLEAADLLRQAPRSQLHHLVEQLAHGERLGELAFKELTDAALVPLRKAMGQQQGVWQPLGDRGHKATSLLDLIEISEIPRLGLAVDEEPTSEARGARAVAEVSLHG